MGADATTKRGGASRTRSRDSVKRKVASEATYNDESPSEQHSVVEDDEQEMSLLTRNCDNGKRKVARTTAAKAPAAAETSESVALNILRAADVAMHTEILPRD